MDSGTWVPLCRRAAREAAQGLLDFLCPPHCPGCGCACDGVCTPCTAELEPRRPPVCERCGEPKLTAGAPCLADHRRIRGLRMARTPWRYRGCAGRMVRRLKFQRDDGAADHLGRAMADTLREWARGPGRRAVVVSVPLHRRKRRTRGVDQAAQLAEGVAQRLRLRFVPRALRRCRDTLPQGDPRVTSRQENVRGAFAVRRRSPIRQRLVVLVDDVTTSGNTARECAGVLTAAGARGVVLLAAADAGP